MLRAWTSRREGEPVTSPLAKAFTTAFGAPLARLEGQIAIDTLLRRMPNLRLAVDPQELAWRPGLLMMGLSKLPIKF